MAPMSLNSFGLAAGTPEPSPEPSCVLGENRRRPHHHGQVWNGGRFRLGLVASEVNDTVVLEQRRVGSGNQLTVGGVNNQMLGCNCFADYPEQHGSVQYDGVAGTAGENFMQVFYCGGVFRILQLVHGVPDHLLIQLVIEGNLPRCGERLDGRLLAIPVGVAAGDGDMTEGRSSNLLATN